MSVSVSAALSATALLADVGFSSGRSSPSSPDGSSVSGLATSLSVASSPMRRALSGALQYAFRLSAISAFVLWDLGKPADSQCSCNCFCTSNKATTVSNQLQASIPIHKIAICHTFASMSANHLMSVIWSVSHEQHSLADHHCCQPFSLIETKSQNCTDQQNSSWMHLMICVIMQMLHSTTDASTLITMAPPSVIILHNTKHNYRTPTHTLVQIIRSSYDGAYAKTSNSGALPWCRSAMSTSSSTPLYVSACMLGLGLINNASGEKAASAAARSAQQLLLVVHCQCSHLQLGLVADGSGSDAYSDASMLYTDCELVVKLVQQHYDGLYWCILSICYQAMLTGDHHAEL